MLALLLPSLMTAKSIEVSGPTRVTTLDRAPTRREVEVMEILGGRQVSNSLAQLGIRVGELLRVKRSAPLGGAVLVDTGERSVALGRGLARKVKVQIRS